jgi:SsrA-binding protein
MVKSEKKSSLISHGTVCLNRRAHFNYAITEKIEAGLALLGGEVKALRMGRANISDSYVGVKQGKLKLFNMHIAFLPTVSKFTSYEEKRARDLLLHQKEINKILGSINKEKINVIPLAVYFNSKGLAKVELGLGKSKNLVDKRQTIKDREWARDKARVLKG